MSKHLMFLTNFRLQLTVISALFHPLGLGISELLKRAMDQSLSNNSLISFSLAIKQLSYHLLGNNLPQSHRAAVDFGRSSNQGTFFLKKDFTEITSKWCQPLLFSMSSDSRLHNPFQSFRFKRVCFKSHFFHQ